MLMNLMCRCLGALGQDPCLHKATQEDGLCDHCRRKEGTCYDTPEAARMRKEFGELHRLRGITDQDEFEVELALIEARREARDGKS